MKLHMKKVIACFGLIVIVFPLFLAGGKIHAYGQPSIIRLWGNDRYETAIAISKQGWQTSDYVVLSRGDDFPDALCAAPLAYAYDAPILLTEPRKLSSGVLEEIERLKAKHVIITGGTGAVSLGIEDAIKQKGLTVERLGGADRYETSVEIAKRVGSRGSLVLATGDNFPDTLSISSIAAKLGMPILLTPKTYIPYSVWQYMENSGYVSTTYIVGGRGVISDSLMELVRNPKRLGGNNRYETNVAVLKEFFDELDFKNIFISVADGPNGDEFADALAGSVLAAKSSSPMVLTYKTMPAAADYFIRPKVSDECTMTMLGGEAAVPSTIAFNLLDQGKSPVAIGIENPPSSIRSWQTKTVSITTNPYDAKITASSSNSKVAVVSVSGKSLTITGVSPGAAVISVTAERAGYPAGNRTFMVTSPVYNVRRDTYHDTIQGAIDYAYSGDTIRIASGTYYEHINIRANNLKLIGEDRDSTIIDATQNGSVTRAGIRIKDYSGTEIRNLTVRNAGVNATGEATKEPYGIFLWNSDQNTLSNLSLKSNGSYEIYMLDGSDNNTVTGCIIDGSGAGRDGYRSLDGIFSIGGESINGSPGMVNFGNRFFSNVICNVVNGISLTASNNSLIMNNEIRALDSSYWKGYSSAGIILGNSSNNIVSGNTIDSSQYGIRLSSFSVISPYNYAGIPSSNILQYNEIATLKTGIRVLGMGNMVRGNRVAGNSESGIWLADTAWSSKVLENIIEGNTIGVLADNGMNEVHQNSIIGGTYGLKNTSDIELDAIENWWGSSSGPGGRIYGKVKFSPWALDETFSEFSK